MDLFLALPSFRRHPFLCGKNIALVGVSTIACDGAACYFEIGKPRYWQRREDGTTAIGFGGIGGSIKQDETIVACLRRKVREELGVRVRLEPSQRAVLIHDWRIIDTMELSPSKKRPNPQMLILLPPRLGGPGTPDYLAIASFRSRLQSSPAPRDLFGLLRIEHLALGEFFARDEWSLGEAQAHPGLTIVLNDQSPDNAILRPTLAARAFQLVVRAGDA